MRRGSPGSYRYVVVDAPDRGSSEQMFYGDYDYRFGKERTEEARSSIQQARSARYDTRRSTVARGTTLFTAFSGNGLVATRTLSWSGPKGSEIGFDDEHFGLGDMRGEIKRMEDAYPNPPNEVPQGTSFVFSRDSTGHLDARCNGL
jgi:hypothetical protein